MLGSSNIYSTPTSAAPIWVASRMRCASPPLNVPLSRFKREVAQPDIFQKPQPRTNFLDDLETAIFCSKLRQLERGEKVIRLFDGQARRHP